MVDGDLSGSHLLPSSSFHLAASKGLTECLTLLLAHGAPINEKNDDGKWRTPWGHLLVYGGGDTAKSEPGQGPVPVSPLRVMAKG